MHGGVKKEKDGQEKEDQNDGRCTGEKKGVETREDACDETTQDRSQG